MAVWLGFVAAAVAVVFFGSQLLPVKRFETGDGLFFQWVMCIGIWLVGLTVQQIRDSPQFEPIAMIGGVLWCTGNLMTVPIIKMIGMGLGLLIWGMSNLVMGWSTGNFGLFGLKKNEVDNPILNYVGVVLAVISVAFYAFVKPSVESSVDEQKTNGEHHGHVEYTDTDDGYGYSRTTDSDGEDPVRYSTNSGSQALIPKKGKVSWVDYLSPLQKRILGVSMAIIAGLFYGVNFTPPQYLIDNDKGSSSGLDYVFSHFCGILLSSTFYFLVYCLLMRNKPKLYPEVIIPGVISGAFWGIAMSFWFVANQELSFVVSFPLVTTGPGAVGAFWGIILFREITGWKNIGFFLLAVGINAIAIVLITLSKLGI